MSGSIRVLPLLVVAGLCLFALKSMGLLLSGGYVVTGVAPAKAQDPKAAAAAREQAGGETAPSSDTVKKTATEQSQEADNKEKNTENTAKSNPETPDKSKPEAASPANAADKSPTDVVNEAPKAQLAVLEGLANRRKELDQREKQIDLRENLLKAAEKRVQARIAELKSIQAQIESELKKQDDFRKAQYASLVKMYSSMKPKNAARIFNRMELETLTGIAIQLKPRIMSAIMAAMEPAAAQRLTLEIANRGRPASKKAASLPKIESQGTN